MKKPLFIAMALIGSQFVTAQQRQPTSQPHSLIAPPVRMNFRDQYSVLYEHNIFLRDRRSQQRDRGNTRPYTRQQYTPEQSYVLTGVVNEDGSYRAYMEDLNRGTIVKLKVGDQIARGQINDIQIDAVAYERNGTQTWIEVGSNLTGSQVQSVSDARIDAALGNTTGPVVPSTQQGDLNLSGMSLEEQMKLRRLKQLQPNAPLPQAMQPTTQPDNMGDQSQQGDNANNGDQPPPDQQPQQQGDNNQQPQPNAQPSQQMQQQAQPAPAGNASGMSLEEQMKQRRAQEQNR